MQENGKVDGGFALAAGSEFAAEKKVGGLGGLGGLGVGALASGRGGLCIQVDEARGSAKAETKPKSHLSPISTNVRLWSI